MGKALTKDARWIVVLVEGLKTDSLGMAVVPHKSVHNIGRYSWNIPEWQAISEAIDFSRCTYVSCYLVDVTLFPYARDWKEVLTIAERWFVSQRMLDKKILEHLS